MKGLNNLLVESGHENVMEKLENGELSRDQARVKKGENSKTYNRSYNRLTYLVRQIKMLCNRLEHVSGYDSKSYVP